MERLRKSLICCVKTHTREAAFRVCYVLWDFFFYYYYYLKGNYEPVLEKKAGVYYLPCQEE